MRRSIERKRRYNKNKLVKRNMIRKYGEKLRENIMIIVAIITIM